MIHEVIVKLATRFIQFIIKENQYNMLAEKL